MAPERPQPRLRLRALGVVVGLAVLAGCGGDDEEAGAPERPASFGYAGSEGPENWAALDPAYEACSAGDRQSPIDLVGGNERELPELELAYRPAELEIENNGHSLEAEYPPGSSLSIGGDEYELQQFHFHAPSEHRFDGRSLPLEFHFVHASEDGRIAVLGVLVEEGEDNRAFSPLTRATPAQEGARAPVGGTGKARDLLPDAVESAPRWSYSGSLTTPPCTEGVRWEVLAEPIELSAAQIERYTAVYDATNRPLQPRNGRRIRLGG
jgi:carbonic anhydrase